MKKSKKKYFASLNEKDIFDKTIKPSLSGKVIIRDRIICLKKGESVKTELETAGVLNKSFSNIIRVLESFKYESFIDYTEGKTLRAILIYKNHPNITRIFL